MGHLSRYLRQCRKRSVVETVIGSEPRVPPSPDEVSELVTYLRDHGLSPVIIGSAAAFYHLGGDPAKFRPTVDVDIHVDKKLPPPPPGWRRDPEAIGTASWISPSGGQVDFLVANEELPGGITVPAVIAVDQTSDEGFPVARIEDVFSMKLNSMREKDLFDAVAIARQYGLPPKKKLGLNPQQSENYDLVAMWIKARPQGAYGE